MRELKEETGLDLEPIDADAMYEKPYFTTIGMTDECCATVYGYASGSVSKKGQEDSEDMEIVLADRAEVRRILKEERGGDHVRLHADALFKRRRRSLLLFEIKS